MWGDEYEVRYCAGLLTMKNKFQYKILFAVGLVTVASFCAFTVYSEHVQRRTLDTQIEGELALTAQTVAKGIQDWMSGNITLLQSTGESFEENHASDAIDKVLARKTLMSTFNAYYGDEQGAMHLRPGDSVPEGYDPRTRDWYKSTITSNTATISEPYQDVSPGGFVVTIAVPVGEANKRLGVVAADLSIDSLVKTINALDFGGLGYAFLFNEEGKILVSPHSSELLKDIKEIYVGANTKLNGELQAINTAGSSRILMFAPINGLPTNGWRLGISLDGEKVYASLAEFRNSVVIAVVICLLLMTAFLSLSIGFLIRPLSRMNSAMKNIIQGEGDLTLRLPKQGSDEFGELADSFNEFVSHVQQIVKEVADSIKELDRVCNDVSIFSKSSLLYSEECSHRTNSVASTISQLESSAQQIAQSAAATSEQAYAARNASEQAKETVDDTSTSMRGLSNKISLSNLKIETLNNKTKDIGKILDVIKNIAKKTNLLALNAAIEAARAGDSGRGFAVVAEEVRGLAQNTQESALEIEEMIQQLQNGSHEAVELMIESQLESEKSLTLADHSSMKLTGVAQKISFISDMNMSVASATEEQSAVVEVIAAECGEINDLIQSSQEKVALTISACLKLTHQSSKLAILVNRFKV